MEFVRWKSQPEAKVGYIKEKMLGNSVKARFPFYNQEDARTKEGRHFASEWLEKVDSKDGGVKDLLDFLEKEKTKEILEERKRERKSGVPKLNLNRDVINQVEFKSAVKELKNRHPYISASTRAETCDRFCNEYFGIKGKLPTENSSLYIGETGWNKWGDAFTITYDGPEIDFSLELGEEFNQINKGNKVEINSVRFGWYLLEIGFDLGKN